jgi:hypothetical protein
MPDLPRIGPIGGGGLILTWRCSNACRHCLYRCGPRQPDAWMPPAVLDRTLDALAAEPAFAGLHLAGGEPMLDPARTEAAVRACVRRGVVLDYLETNAAWAREPAQARDAFRRLADAGLPAVLISASLPHAEFIPPGRTRLAIDAARSVFGERGVLVWTGEGLALLARLPQDRPVPLAESRRILGLDAQGVLDRHPYLIANGRVPACLMRSAPRQPAAAFAGQHCAGVLARTGHVHIDPAGHLFTGHCPGIAPATIDDLHPAIAADSAFAILWRDGPCGLLAHADGFHPDPRGYASACELCWQVRRHLHRAGRFPDLRPAEAYAN